MIIERYYKPETLFAENAHTTWVEPDLKPLPIPLFPLSDLSLAPPGKKKIEKVEKEGGEEKEGNQEEEGEKKEEDAKHIPHVYTFNMPVVIYNENCAVNKN